MNKELEELKLKYIDYEIEADDYVRKLERSINQLEKENQELKQQKGLNEIKVGAKLVKTDKSDLEVYKVLRVNKCSYTIILLNRFCYKRYELLEFKIPLDSVDEVSGSYRIANKQDLEDNEAHIRQRFIYEFQNNTQNLLENLQEIGNISTRYIDNEEIEEDLKYIIEKLKDYIDNDTYEK